MYTGVELIYKVQLVSGLQQSDRAMHIHISSFSDIFSIIGYDKILSRALCAMQ